MLNINELEIATKGKIINGNKYIIPENYVIDSREIKEGDFFVPLIGDKTDGHKYILDSVKKGITGFFISKSCIDKEKLIKESISKNKDICILEVDDTKQALYDAGKYNRQKHINIPVIGITGSVGKTSTREMIASVLRTEKNVLVTQRNYNSIIGAPIMALKIDNQDVCVFEMGTDHKGEIGMLADLLMPNIGVVTMIGTAHIGMFGSKEDIFKEKIEIAKNMDSSNILLINGDDKYLSKVEQSEKFIVEKYLLSNVHDLKEKQDKIEFCANIYDENRQLIINEIGKHNVKNALCAIKIGEMFNISYENIIKGIASYKNFSKRLEKISMRGNITLIDDTYNASIDSMISGLKTVNKMKSTRKIAVLGDMLELGEFSKEIHHNVGKIFKNLNYDILYTLGDESIMIKEGAKEAITKENNIHFKNREELIIELKRQIKSGDIIYFKASNGMKFSNIIESLKQN